MKKIIFLSLVMLLIFNGLIVADSSWLTNYEEAKKQAVKQNKNILIDFTGSDWCGWCIKLDKEVFSQSEFKKYAKENLILFMADFPKKKQLSKEVKKQNEDLAREFGIRGYPTIILVNAKGESIGRTGYKPGGAKVYVQHLKELLKK